MAGFVDKFKRMWDDHDDEYEYDEYGYADEGAEEDYKEEPVRNTKKERDLGGGNKVVNINATTNLQVGLFKPERFGEETLTIADELMKAHTVVLKLISKSSHVRSTLLGIIIYVLVATRLILPRFAYATPLRKSRILLAISLFVSSRLRTTV